MTIKTKTKCCICHLALEKDQIFPLTLLKNDIYVLMKQDHKNLKESDFVCLKEINPYMISGESLAENSENHSQNHKRLSKNPHQSYHETRTFGEKLADQVASFGGSWSFIISFMLFMIIWIIINSHKILENPLDPFPYILLNLILSCLAALQAPIIMMSQNRQEAKDRLRATYDYEVNLKAESEIRMLNKKLDDYIQTSKQQLKHYQEQQKKLNKISPKNKPNP